MNAGAMIRAELFVSKKTRIGLLVVLFYLVFGILYLFAGSGAWVSAGDESQFLGFSADEAYLMSLSIAQMEDYWPVVVSFAHTVLFPVVAVFVSGMIFGIGGSESAESVSLARGSTPRNAFCAKTIIGVMYAIAGYLVFTLLVVFTCAIWRGASLTTSFGVIFTRRLIANLLVNVSYMVMCSAVYSVIDSKSAASGGLLVVTFVGLVVSMSYPDAVAPFHMAYWMRTCGVSGTDPLISAVVYSIVSSGIALFAREAACAWRTAAR